MSIRYKTEIPEELKKLLWLLPKRGGNRMSDHFYAVLEAEISIIFSEFCGINIEGNANENPLCFREQVCLAFYCLGKYQKQVADLMRMSEGCVKVYYSRIREKLEAKSNQEALIKALSMGYLQIWD